MQVNVCGLVYRSLIDGVEIRHVRPTPALVDDAIFSHNVRQLGRILEVKQHMSSGVGAGGGDERDRSPQFEILGIILPTFEAKLHAKITLHGR